MLRSLLALGLVVHCLASGPLSAQQPVVGSMVRVRPATDEGADSAPWTTGPVARIEADSLWIISGGQRRSFAVQDLDVELQQGTAGAAGVILGGLSGVLVGAVLGAALYQPEFAADCALFLGCEEPTQINSRTGDMVQQALSIGLLGGIIGWRIGRSKPGWVPASVEDLRIGPRGFVVGLRF